MDDLSGLKENYKNIIDNLNKLSKKISFLRLFSFLFCLGFFIFGFFNKYLFIVSFLFFIVFIVFVFIHLFVLSKFNYRLETVIEYEKRINRDFLNFKTITDSSDISIDLNLFNDQSIYQLINISKTQRGKKTLKKYLLEGNKLKEKSSILCNKLVDINFHIEFNEVLKKYDKTSHIDITGKVGNVNKYLFIFNFILNALGFIFLILSFKIPIYYSIFLFILNYLIVKIISNKIDIKNLKLITNDILGYMEIIKFLKNYKIDDSYYKSLTDFEIKNINKLDYLLSIMNNELFNIIFNAIFSINTIFILLFKKYNIDLNQFDKIKENVGILEAITSLSVVGIICKNTCIPSYKDELKAIKMGHLMLKNPVLNDFSLKSNQVLITGSNMSGKTTFLRSLAVNIVLANAGGIVVAKSFTLKNYIVKTSLIITDDLYKGISTFEMELKKLKNIIENLSDNSNYIIFIDELFRGTNQLDRIKGAKYLINYLNKKNIDLFLTTHDIELFDLDIEKYHFEEYYEDNLIKFDYLIKEGISTKTNAIELMKMIGLDVK